MSAHSITASMARLPGIGSFLSTTASLAQTQFARFAARRSNKDTFAQSQTRLLYCDVTLPHRTRKDDHPGLQRSERQAS